MAPTSQISMVWSPSTKLLFSAGVDLEVCAWDIENRAIRKKLKDHTDMIMHIVAIEKLDILATASLDKTINLYGMKELRHYGECKGHRKGVRRLLFAHDLLFSCGFEFDIYGWFIDVNEAGRRSAHGDLTLRLKGHEVMLLDVCSVEYPDDGGAQRIVSCDVSGVFKLWDVGSAARRRRRAATARIFSPRWFRKVCSLQ